MATDAPRFHDDEYQLPCAEALLAGTLALMTGCLQACCADQRDRMAGKVVANLQFLAQHPAFSAPFKRLLEHLHARWQDQLAAAPMPGDASNRALWHATPDTLQ